VSWGRSAIDTGTAILIVIGTILGTIALTLIGAAWSGFVLSILWGWFVVPRGVRAINVPWAIGLCLIIYRFTAGIRKRKSDPWTGAEIVGAIGGWFLGTLAALGFGYWLSTMI
jgi:hypothetical protein